MQTYKQELITFLIKTGALSVFDSPENDRSLKSKRLSPWFVNMGEFNDGESTSVLGNVYAGAIADSEINFDSLYGIPEKGVALAIATSIGLISRGVNAPWFFTRKDEKTHGEASNLPSNERAKKLIVGRVPKQGDNIIQLDDVFTAGDAKYEARTELESFGKFNYPLLVIAVDRQEVGTNASGISAIDEYESKTGTKVISVVTASDVYTYLKERTLISPRALERLENYLRVYGNKKLKETVGKLEQTIIGRNRSVIPACDVSSIEEFDRLVEQTSVIDGVGAYKVGFGLGLRYGLPKVVEVARKHTDKPIIYDHQKAATDIPDTGRDFAELNKEAGVDAVILFPQAGPETERAWIYHALDNRLKVIVGGRMTHPAYAVSEGGFITDEGALDIYRIAASIGVRDFVVPGNKPDVIRQVKETVESEGVINPRFYAPGFITQGGKISDAALAAGEYFHGIVGRGIYQSGDVRDATLEHCSQL
ncbi:orotidine 5'-phosphate decarboxylase [Candidatus Pacearchaeota archaeon]|nr:orotidine 5'-phosphate decarboxylase [Candidatus Pacearchaeota archaeon]